MKFGLIIDFCTPAANLGDYVQSIAIAHLYSQMDVPESDIIHLSAKDLTTYDGEMLVLPFNYMMEFLPPDLSKSIIPVFLGATVVGAYVANRSPDLGAYIGKYAKILRLRAPLGCRDDFTRQALEAQGIASYLQGCITNTFPLRPNNDFLAKEGKIFLIDCPMETLQYMPEEILKNAEVLTNAAEVVGMSAEERWHLVNERYNYIRDNARMVISSRYHIVTPCNAMGIPTIFIKRSLHAALYDIRLDTLNPEIPLYTYEDLDKINWNPQVKNFEQIKSKIAGLAISRIKEAYECAMVSSDIQEFYRPRIEKFKDIEPLGIDNVEKRIEEFLAEYFLPPKKGGFYIWGAKESYNVQNIAQKIAEMNPGLEFEGFIDTFKTGILADKPIFKPNMLERLQSNEFVVLIADSAIPDALRAFKRNKLNKGQYLILANQMVDIADINELR